MTGVLFVTNGHGEAAIGGRIARELRRLDPAIRTDHLALVGEGFGDAAFHDVGPQRRMPSGGLIAMGNVRNIVRDLRAGLAGLALAQAGFLLRRGSGYRCIVAIGDVYALLQAFAGRRPTVFVGTAKSVYVAGYDAFERFVLRTARGVFVRDIATANALRRRGIGAEAPGNVIVDLLADAPPFPWPSPTRVALFPGSRESAYADAVTLARIADRLGSRRGTTSFGLSIAPTLRAERFAEVLAADGWSVGAGLGTSIPFEARFGATLLRAWSGPFGSLVAGATLACGQAGTVNEAAVAAGTAVVAVESGHDSPAEGWYRMRQTKLLGDALAVVPADPDEAARRIGALLDDPHRRARMGAIGRERMGPPGGAAAIAQRIAQFR